jgi:hypothetical protein
VTDSQQLSVELAQRVQLVHDIADYLAARMSRLSTADAEAFLDERLARLAVRWKRLEGKSNTPEAVSSVGYKLSAAIRSRVTELLKSQ